MWSALPVWGSVSPPKALNASAVERDRIEAITPGRCRELVDCGHFERASRPVPANYLPSGHIKDSLPFTRTFMYGAYEGELIFWEPMITLDFLRDARDACFEIHQPAGFRKAGYYPTQYCVRRNQRGERSVHHNIHGASNA